MTCELIIISEWNEIIIVHIPFCNCGFIVQDNYVHVYYVHVHYVNYYTALHLDNLSTIKNSNLLEKLNENQVHVHVHSTVHTCTCTCTCTVHTCNY